MTGRAEFLAAVTPLVAAVDGQLVSIDDMADGDVPLSWAGEAVAGVRLGSLDNALDHLIAQVESELGARLTVMTRTKKQRAIRMLDERGAFALRRSVELVADAMGVSRITVYNYLNAIRDEG